MLSAFFDASATEVQDGVTAIGGYVAPLAAWRQLEPLWVREVDQWGLQRFHRSDIRRHLGRERGELCIRSFAQLIKPILHDAIWAAVIDEDWGVLEKPPAFATRFPSSMHFCFGHVIAQLDQWCRITAPGELVAPVFDEDMEPKAANAIFEEYKANPHNPNLIASLTWGNDKRHPMIQAADLVVGELREYWFDRVYPAEGGPEFNFAIQIRAALSGKAFSDSGLWDLRSLQVAVRDFVNTGDPFGEPDIGTRIVQGGRRIRPEED